MYPAHIAVVAVVSEYCGCLGFLLHHVGHVMLIYFLVCFRVFENAFRTSAGTCPTAGSFAASQLLPCRVAVPR
jgi:hypothetical protein